MVFLKGLLAVMQILSAVGIIALVLLQQGKGADMGTAFGSGSSASLFGASGSANFLSRTTAILATLFFACTLALAFFSNHKSPNTASVLEHMGATTPTESSAPTSSPAARAPSDATSKGVPQ
jgi:preprotein translocase subunit SecG